MIIIDTDIDGGLKKFLSSLLSPPLTLSLSLAWLVVSLAWLVVSLLFTPLFYPLSLLPSLVHLVVSKGHEVGLLLAPYLLGLKAHGRPLACFTDHYFVNPH